MNEVIGRQYFGTRDAGDTIFVHMFGAYFGLAVSYMIWDQKIEDSQNKGEDKYSNMFSMVSTTEGNEASLQESLQTKPPVPYSLVDLLLLLLLLLLLHCRCSGGDNLPVGLLA